MNGTTSSSDLILGSNKDLFYSDDCIVFQDFLKRIGDALYNPVLAMCISVLHFLKPVEVILFVDEAHLIKDMKHPGSHHVHTQVQF